MIKFWINETVHLSKFIFKIFVHKIFIISTGFWGFGVSHCNVRVGEKFFDDLSSATGSIENWLPHGNFVDTKIQRLRRSSKKSFETFCETRRCLFQGQIKSRHPWIRHDVTSCVIHFFNNGTCFSRRSSWISTDEQRNMQNQRVFCNYSQFQRWSRCTNKIQSVNQLSLSTLWTS